VLGIVLSGAIGAAIASDPQLARDMRSGLDQVAARAQGALHDLSQDGTYFAGTQPVDARELDNPAMPDVVTRFGSPLLRP
jgi:hypothetical protein